MGRRRTIRRFIGQRPMPKRASDMLRALKYIFVGGLALAAIPAVQVIAQMTDPGVQQIVNALGGYLPGQSTVNLKGSLIQCRAQNAEATALSNAQNVDVACDLFGRPVVLPYTTKEKWIRGNAT